MCQLMPVEFHGDTIYCLEYEGQPFTPMRPLVDNMGMDWKAQSAKLNANREPWTVVMITTVAQDGKEREMLCMPVRKLPAWLASINPKKVKPELREKIERYQAECDDALWNYWVNSRAEQAAKIEQPKKRRTERQKPTRFDLPVPEPQPGDKYYALLEKVEAWRIKTLAEREKLLYEALALIDIEKTGRELYNSCAAYTRHWLEAEALGPISIFHDCLDTARAPITMIKRINESFGSAF